MAASITPYASNVAPSIQFSVAPKLCTITEGRMDFLIALLLAGEFLNPVIPGDWPDPALIRVGADYYSVRSTFGWTPGLQIAHSRDLVHWRYIGFGIASHPDIEPGATRGGVWGSEMGYNPNTGTFLLYAPIGNRIRAMASKSPGGPYSAPVDLGLQGIDPGFFADDDGRLYLVWDWGRIVELARDGLSVKGEVCDTRLGRGRDFEGPDIFKRGRWYYCLYSTGGTRPYQKSAVNTARARDLRGPWERDPANPQLQADESGPAHGTLMETQRGTPTCPKRDPSLPPPTSSTGIGLDRSGSFTDPWSIRSPRVRGGCGSGRGTCSNA